MAEDLEELKDLKEYLFKLSKRLAEKELTGPWTN